MDPRAGNIDPTGNASSTDFILVGRTPRDQSVDRPDGWLLTENMVAFDTRRVEPQRGRRQRGLIVHKCYLGKA